MKKIWIISILFMLCGCVIQPNIKEEPTVVPTPSVVPSSEPTLETTPEVTPVMLNVVDFSREDRSNFQSVWTVSGDSISYRRNIDGNSHELIIDSWNDPENTISLSSYGIPIENGNSYTIRLNASSNIASQLRVEICDYDEVLYEKLFSIDENSKDCVFSFSMNKDTIWDGKVVLRFEKKEGVESGHIIVDHLSVLANKTVLNAKVNQLGYAPDSQKTAVFAHNSGDTFEIIDVSTGQPVYQGLITGKVVNEDALEINYIGDFSDYTVPGKYRIQTQILSSSYEFEIKEKPYDLLLNDALIALSSQRCGSVLSSEVFGDLAHEACHTSEAISVVNDTKVNVTGGWHDAGDYGRYVTPGVKAVSDLLLAQLMFPNSYHDEMGIMESGNGISDVLDEARVEIEWLLKMQRETNAFYNSVISKSFADFVSPEEDNQQLYLMQQENTATAAASGALALASILYRDVDSDFSQICLEAAKSGFAHAEWQEGSQDFLNPEGFNNGDYPNQSDVDELYYAAMSLYAATEDPIYLEHVNSYLSKLSNITELTYDVFSGYGTIIYLLMDNSEDSLDLYLQVHERFQKEIQELLNRSARDGYHSSNNYTYSWGASMYVSNSAMLLLSAYELYHDEDLIPEIQNQLDYLLGKNAINLSFVTGYGKKYPRYPHNRLTIGKQTYLKGSLVAGIDRNLGSEVLAGSEVKDVAPAKRYIDHQESYTNNEVAIYFNSSFIFVLGGINYLN